MKDIAPELLERLQATFREKFNASEKIKELNKRLAEGVVSHHDSHALAVEVGNILAEVYQENISGEVLPDGKMYFNIAERIITPTLEQNHTIISEYAKAVQTTLNHQANLRIKAEGAALNKDRIRGIIEKVVAEDDFNKVKWVLDEPVKNFSQAIVDDTVQTNVALHHKLGLKPKIVRKEAGNCCDWCKAVAGVYEYPNVPKDVFRRHRFCRCTVEYEPGDGRRQNVHTRKWVDPKQDEKIEARKRANLDVKMLNRKEDADQYKRYMKILGTERMPKSLPLFQEMKYNNLEEYERLKDQAFIQNNFNKGIWKDAINPEKQQRHIQSTAGEGKSYFYDDVDVKALYEKYKMTGTLKAGKSSKSNKELIDFDHGVDYGVDIYTGKPANGMVIHYSKTGVHLVPTYHEVIK